MARHINSLVETAIANLYASSSNWPVDVNIYKGEDNEEKEAPAVIVNAASAVDLSPPSRVWNVTTDIITKEMAYDSDGSEPTIADFAEELLFVSASSITHSNLYISDIHSQGTTMTRQGDAWVSTLTLNVFCKKTES